MYHCYNPKRFFTLLLIDAIVVILWLLCTVIGKLVFSADEPHEGVFLPIITYHSVASEESGSYEITAEQFEADLQYLQANGYETVSAAQLADYTNGTGELPAHPILLTFDDGLCGNLSLALPLLEKYDMCAVVSVVGKYTDESTVSASSSDERSYLTWEEIGTLLDSGRVEIGNHTYDLHSTEQRAGCSIMVGEDEAQYASMLKADLERLQSRMQEEIGSYPTIFSYPYGYVCKESVPILKELGFVCSFTSYERPNYITRDPNCLYGLDRYHRSSRDSTEEFFWRVLGKGG